MGRGRRSGVRDSAPILERAWAERRGWGGLKAQSVPQQEHGQLFFLAEMLLDVDLSLTHQSPIIVECTR